jgi:hypothetical protein
LTRWRAAVSRRSPASAEGRVELRRYRLREFAGFGAVGFRPPEYFRIFLQEHLRMAQELEGPVKATKAGR